jgi:poly-gamma-glutamate capsule biosynthesis protein CapA/YwtB (metallophosphatase superfamily)
VESTINKIKEQGLSSVGTYTSKEEYHAPIVLQVKGVNVAVLSFSESEKYASTISADHMNYVIKHIKLDTIKKGIAEAKEGGAQIIIVMLHWGDTKTAPTSEMKSDAKKILEYGADAVIGSGPMVVEPIEKLTVTREDDSTATGIVAYSLGSFLSGQTAPKKDSGLILNLTFEKDTATNAITLKDATYIPTYVYSKSGKDYSILPAGKYKDSQDLLDTLSSNGKSRVPKVWDEVIAAVKNEDLTPTAG